MNVTQLTIHSYHNTSNGKPIHYKDIVPVMVSVLSLMMMSGLKSIHESRLLSKQRLLKKMARKSGSHNMSRQHVISCLLIGWFLKQQDFC